MDLDALLSELGASQYDKEERARIIERLAEPGAEAVPGLLAAVKKVDRRTFFGIREALSLIGPPAFDAAVAARARDEKVPDWWELGHVLRAFDERCLDRYVAALDHPMREIRVQALGGLNNLGPKAAPAIPALIPFLTDPHSYTRYQAENALRAIGDAAVAPLQAIRLEGPARLRRHAFTALMHVGGEAVLGDRDRRVLDRLIRLKIASETTVTANLPEGVWVAVHGAAYEGLFEVMGLHDRRPCTVSMGLSTLGDDTATVTGPDGGETKVYRVFVTPELDGWRLVYAPTPLWELYWDLQDLVADLSGACGKAQVFYQDDHGGAMVWLAGEDGALVRGYWRDEDPEWIGDPMEWEARLEEDEAEDYPDNATEETEVSGAAMSLSVYPPLVGERTAVRGHGWLAVTEPGVGHAPFRGPLSV